MCVFERERGKERDREILFYSKIAVRTFCGPDITCLILNLSIGNR